MVAGRLRNCSPAEADHSRWFRKAGPRASPAACRRAPLRTKVHLAADGRPRPLDSVTAGQTGDAPACETAKSRIRVPRTGLGRPGPGPCPFWPTARTPHVPSAAHCGAGASGRSCHSRPAESATACDEADSAAVHPASRHASIGAPSSGASATSSGGGARPHASSRSPIRPHSTSASPSGHEADRQGSVHQSMSPLLSTLGAVTAPNQEDRP